MFGLIIAVILFIPAGIAYFNRSIWSWTHTAKTMLIVL